MTAILRVIFIFTIIVIITECSAQDEDSDGGPLTRTFRFHLPGLSPTSGENCEYRRQQGTCQRRSNCRRPTRKICSLGLNPVVCCLDEPQKLILTTKPARTSPPVRPQPIPSTSIAPPKTRPPVRSTQTPKIEDAKELDLTFPGCGLRSPLTSTPAPKTAPISSRQRTWPFNRRGRRELLREECVGVSCTARTLSRWKRRNKPVIVGGVTAVANSWPWMVAIFKKKTYAAGSNRFLCGASLVSQKYVLTAAHCFDGERGNIDPSNFLISVGAHNTKDGSEYPVDNIRIHPGYKTSQYYNDMCILRIPREVTLSNKVYPVCLPSAGIQPRIVNNAPRDVIVTGWGDTSFGGVSSKVLQEVSLPIVSQKQCNESYARIATTNFPKGITDVFLCAGLKEGGKDACQGDSGGPMVVKMATSEQWVQLGIVSFGYGCAQPGFPGVYTQVAKFTRWLYENTDLGK